MNVLFNNFLSVLFILPMLSFLFGMVGQIFIKKTYIVIGVFFLLWIIFAVLATEISLLSYAIAYSIICFLGTLLFRGV